MLNSVSLNLSVVQYFFAILLLLFYLRFLFSRSVSVSPSVIHFSRSLYLSTSPLLFLHLYASSLTPKDFSTEPPCTNRYHLLREFLSLCLSVPFCNFLHQQASCSSLNVLRRQKAVTIRPEAFLSHAEGVLSCESATASSGLCGEEGNFSCDGIWPL